jgi:sugar phosphate isomerase/epimerase
MVGIQLFTLQEQLAGDLRDTLAKLRGIGYREVEPAGLLGFTPAEYREALDGAGLVAPSAHILSAAAQTALLHMATGRLAPTDAWARVNAAMELARVDSIMDEMFVQQASLGNEYLVLAALDPELLRSRSGLARVAAAFNRAADLCHSQGVTFAWHPHLAEFAVLEGKRAVDWILEATHPGRVFVELDFFWAAAAAVDIAALLRRHSGRFRLGHVKDVSKSVVVPPLGFADINDVPPEAFEDVGYGTLDYSTLIPLAREAGMRHFFVERDYAPTPLHSARRSFEAMTRLV